MLTVPSGVALAIKDDVLMDEFVFDADGKNSLENREERELCNQCQRPLYIYILTTTGLLVWHYMYGYYWYYYLLLLWYYY